MIGGIFMATPQPIGVSLAKPRFRVNIGHGKPVQELSLEETARILLGKPLPVPFAETENIDYKILHTEYHLPHEVCMEIQLLWRMVHMMEYRRVVPTWPRFTSFTAMARTIAPLYMGLRHEVFRIFFLDKTKKVIEVIGAEGFNDKVLLPGPELNHLIEFARTHPTVRYALFTHNHPWAADKPDEYQPKPSDIDAVLTTKLMAGLAPFDVSVLDHVVVTTLRDPKTPNHNGDFDLVMTQRGINLGFYSFRGHGHLQDG
jgi:DNA repair protein RadC